MPDLQYDRFLYDKMVMCYFPGAAFYRLTGRFIRIEKEVSISFCVTLVSRETPPRILQEFKKSF